jgi:hypothetical protein
MSEKLRSVNTRFWEDSFVEELSPSEKLLFLYLLTNPLTNILGIYEITIKRICYDTGLTKETVLKGLKSFETVNKVLMIDGFVILPNFLRNQNLNENMKIGVVNIFKSLPIVLKEKLLGNDYITIQNDYISLLNGLVKLNRIEREIEKEEERESKAEKVRITYIPPTLDEVKIYFKENGYSDEAAIKAFEHYSLGNWHDTNGKPVFAWKQKMHTVWFKPENKNNKQTAEEFKKELKSKMESYGS